jgi:hypothetical protein
MHFQVSCSTGGSSISPVATTWRCLYASRSIWATDRFDFITMESYLALAFALERGNTFYQLVKNFALCHILLNPRLLFFRYLTA